MLGHRRRPDPLLLEDLSTTRCPTGGTGIGSGGNGATTWTNYLNIGTINQQRVKVYAKDGSSTGSFARSFSDGLGQIIETCHNIDPTTTAGAGTNNEVCTYTDYDNMGRAYKSYSPYFKTSPTVAAEPTSGQYTQSCYDLAGRVTASAFVWNNASWTCGTAPPATSYASSIAYSISGSTHITTGTNAKGNQSRTVVDLLGHVIESDEYLCASSPCTTSTGTKLATTMSYDASGRLTATSDPLGNTLTFGYDRLTRKTSMHDPDMGNWTYAYDSNSQMTAQTDARGATIYMSYDSLNRVTLKNLPWNDSAGWHNAPAPATGDGVGDVRYYYDGNTPSTCPSGLNGICDDHCSTTTDTCNAAVIAYTHTGTTCSTVSY